MNVIVAIPNYISDPANYVLQSKFVIIFHQQLQDLCDLEEFKEALTFYKRMIKLARINTNLKIKEDKFVNQNLHNIYDIIISGITKKKQSDLYIVNKYLKIKPLHHVELPITTLTNNSGSAKKQLEKILGTEVILTLEYLKNRKEKRNK